MDRTGFSADQGSVSDKSLDTLESVEVKFPTLKHQTKAMCVVSDSSHSARGNAPRESFEEADNVSHASSSKAYQIAMLEASIKAKEEKLLEFILEAQIAEHQLNLIKAQFESSSSSSSSRSVASSRTSGRRPTADQGEGVALFLGRVNDVSRELPRS